MTWYQNSILKTKNQTPKTKNSNKDYEYESDLRSNEVNMKYIYLYILLSYIHSAVINQERKLQPKMNKILQRKWNTRKIQIEKHQQHDLLTT